MNLPLRLFAALPTLAVAGAFALTWHSPTLLHEHAVRALVVTVLLEFFVLHSAGFLNGVAVGNERNLTQWLMIVGIAAACLLLVGGFAASIGDPWPLGAFAGLFALRVIDGMSFAGDVETRRFWLMGSWAFGVASYLFSLFAALIADVPELGVPPAMAAADMEWLSVEPHRMLAAGAFYFTAVGLFELLLAVLDGRRAKRPVRDRLGRRQR